MIKTVRKINLFTDFIKSLNFWVGLILSGAGGKVLYMMKDLFSEIAGAFLIASGMALWTLFIVTKIMERKTRKEISETSQEPLEPEQVKETHPVYLSLQDAASFLLKNSQITSDMLPHIAKFPTSVSIEDIFLKRDNPDIVHTEILDEITTIPLINLCLHMFKKNNLKVYGQKPLSDENIPIQYEYIKYFDADYKKLYSDIERQSSKLIYNNISVMQNDLNHAIKNTDLDGLLGEMNAHGSL